MAYPQTDMTEHLIDEHGVTPKRLRELYENMSPELSMRWDDLLDANHDLLHALKAGEVIKGLGKVVQ